MSVSLPGKLSAMPWLFHVLLLFPSPKTETRTNETKSSPPPTPRPVASVNALCFAGFTCHVIVVIVVVGDGVEVVQQIARPLIADCAFHEISVRRKHMAQAGAAEEEETNRGKKTQNFKIFARKTARLKHWQAETYIRSKGDIGWPS